jgi:hypothetical protein
MVFTFFSELLTVHPNALIDSYGVPRRRHHYIRTIRPRVPVSGDRHQESRIAHDLGDWPYAVLIRAVPNSCSFVPIIQVMICWIASVLWSLYGNYFGPFAIVVDQETASTISTLSALRAPVSLLAHNAA